MEIWLECHNYEIEHHNINIPIRINDPPFVVQQLVYKLVDHTLYIPIIISITIVISELLG